MNKKTFLFTMIIISSMMIIVFASSTMAQPSFPAEPAQTPIDGGLGFLAAAGSAYAIKKLREKQKKER